MKIIVALQFGAGAILSIGAAASMWGMSGAILAFGITQMFCALVFLADKK